MAPDAPPRRFAPEPIETSSKSSRQNSQQNGNKAPRKFAVEPVESTSKSSKDKSNGKTQTVPDSAPKRFAPQPVETTTRSSRKTEETTAKPKSRFLPQPVETSAKSNRRNQSPEEPTSPKSQAPVPEKPVRRKFAPQLIDTSARTRKATDTKPVLLPTEKTDITPGVYRPSHHNSGQTITPHEPASSSSSADHARFLLPFERRRERSDSRNSGRTHSFRLPDLETIESSESDNSLPPSLSNSPSSDDSPLASSDAVVTAMYKHATRIRESVDENFAHYLLELEARRAEQKLQEQALAAFPNSDFHEPVQHYVGEDDESEEAIDDRPATWEGHDDEESDDETPFSRRRSSTRGSNWEMRAMQQHAERREQERKAAGTTAKRKESSTPSPWWNPAANDYPSAEDVRDPEMGKMLDRARPPMLGSELRFPRSASPEPARFDVTQGSSKLRSQMCYLTEQSEGPDDDTSPEGLWGQKKQSTTKSAKSTKSNASQVQGLWGGYCVDDHEEKPNGLMPPTGPTGLLTPRVEPGNPFESMSFQVPESVTLPLTPPVGGFDLSGNPMLHIDGILNDERELDDLMERDYPDTFITQVYNYLSLGYPSLARPFDEELSKISRVPISDLRHDDEVAKDMPKGYIRLGDDFEGRGDGTDQALQNGGCARWRALKKYVREWARQEKDMVRTEGLGGNWGTGARRGSWAW